MTPSITMPAGYAGDVASTTKEVFSSFAPYIALIIGIILFFLIFNRFIGWLQDVRIQKEGEESLAVSLVKSFKIKPRARERALILAKKDKRIRKALEMRKKFEEVMEGEGISVET